MEILLGQTVVLGQAGLVFGNAARIFVDDAVREQADKSGVTAFYIVRASVDAK